MNCSSLFHAGEQLDESRRDHECSHSDPRRQERRCTGVQLSAQRCVCQRMQHVHLRLHKGFSGSTGFLVLAQNTSAGCITLQRGCMQLPANILHIVTTASTVLTCSSNNCVNLHLPQTQSCTPGELWDQKWKHMMTGRELRRVVGGEEQVGVVLFKTQSVATLEPNQHSEYDRYSVSNPTSLIPAPQAVAGCFSAGGICNLNPSKRQVCQPAPGMNLRLHLPDAQLLAAGSMAGCQWGLAVP